MINLACCYFGNYKLLTCSTFQCMALFCLVYFLKLITKYYKNCSKKIPISDFFSFREMEYYKINMFG